MELLAIPELASPWLALSVALIVATAAIVQYGLGMGFGLTAAPLLALIDPQLVPAPVLFLGMFTSGWGAWSERHAIRWNEIAIGIGGRIVGVTAATMTLAQLSEQRHFTFVFGTLIGLAVLLSVSGWRLGFSRASLAFMSAVSGLMATITSVGAPPLALVYQDRPALEARPTLAAFFAFGCAIALVGLFVTGFAGWRDVVLAAFMTPPMLIGLVVARNIQGRFDRRYRPALLSLAGCAALLLMYRGVT